MFRLGAAHWRGLRHHLVIFASALILACHHGSRASGRNSVFKCSTQISNSKTRVFPRRIRTTDYKCLLDSLRIQTPTLPTFSRICTWYIIDPWFLLQLLPRTPCTSVPSRLCLSKYLKTSCPTWHTRRSPTIRECWGLHIYRRTLLLVPLRATRGLRSGTSATTTLLPWSASCRWVRLS